MKEIPNKIFVSFYDGRKLIQPKNNPYSPIDESGRLYLDLTNEKDRVYLNLIMKADIFTIGDNGVSCKLSEDRDIVTPNEIEYKCVSRKLMLDGSAMFIILERL